MQFRCGHVGDYLCSPGAFSFEIPSSTEVTPDRHDDTRLGVISKENTLLEPYRHVGSPQLSCLRSPPNMCLLSRSHYVYAAKELSSKGFQSPEFSKRNIEGYTTGGYHSTGRRRRKTNSLWCICHESPLIPEGHWDPEEDHMHYICQIIHSYHLTSSHRSSTYLCIQHIPCVLYCFLENLISANLSWCNSLMLAVWRAHSSAKHRSPNAFGHLWSLDCLRYLFWYEISQGHAKHSQSSKA